MPRSSVILSLIACATLPACGRVGFERVEDGNGIPVDAAIDGDARPAPWWDPTFARRVRLFFDQSSQSETLSDFPVFVGLDTPE